jgi:serine/threonine-protein kinase
MSNDQCSMINARAITTRDSFNKGGTMIGQTIGSYRIEQKIGEGGMGAVYRGRDLMLEREVAIKALRPELARQPELVARFRTEAVTLAKLNHSNIAMLYNFVRHGDDFFMMMEFVRGRTLEEVLRQEGALKVERAVQLFCQALDGIAHAHSLGVVHRDIKPANVMLTSGGEVKAMDFGIARVLGTARQTKTGRLLGTLEYMPPEQMRGQETDARADIYSLGILLYEMLTGRVPFQCDSDYELMRAQVEEQPPSPREFNGGIPLPVELAILRALAKDPEARFQSAAEFRAVLISAVPAAAFKPEPVQAAAAGPVMKATRVAAAQEESGSAYDWQRPELQFTDERQSPGRQSGYDSNTGTYTLKLPPFLLTARQKLEARFGPLNWKHYGSAAAAVLALGIGVYSLAGKTPQAKPVNPLPALVEPVAIEKKPVIEPLPAAMLPAVSPTPATVPANPQSSAISSSPIRRSKSEAMVRMTPTPYPSVRYYPTPYPRQPQVADNYRPVYQPPANPRPMPVATPQPSPTPKPNKFDRTMEKVGKSAEAAEGIWGMIKKRKN